MARQSKAAIEEAARRVAGIMAYREDALTQDELDAIHQDADVQPRPVPTEPATPSAELVPVASNGRGQKYADLTSIVEVAETLRFDAHTTVGLETELDAQSDLLALARAQEANREVVDPATIRQLQDHHDRFGNQLKSWQLQRGIKDNGGGSS